LDYVLPEPDVEAGSDGENRLPHQVVGGRRHRGGSDHCAGAGGVNFHPAERDAFEEAAGCVG
jgi:hypothetical protein